MHPLDAQPSSDLCPYCIAHDGLCGREDCRRQVLPQLARPVALLRLIGEARVEQTKRQKPKEQKEQKETRQLQRIARRNARKVARSQRRGYFGLARAILEK